MNEWELVYMDDMVERGGREGEELFKGAVISNYGK